MLHLAAYVRDHVCYLHNELWSRSAISARSGATMRAKFRARVVIDAPKFPFATRVGERRNDTSVRQRDSQTRRCGRRHTVQSISLIGRQLCCPPPKGRVALRIKCHALARYRYRRRWSLFREASINTFVYLI